MIRSNLCNYSDVYIHVKGTIIVWNTGTASNNRNKKVIFKNCDLLSNCIIEIKYTQVDDAHDFDAVMPKYNLIEYSDIYSKKSESSWQYYRDKQTLDGNNNIIDFIANNSNSISNAKKKWQGNSCIKDVELMVPLKYISNFWRTLEMSLINCEISLMLTWW